MKKGKLLTAALAAVLAVALIGACTGAMNGGGDERPGQEGSGEHGSGDEGGGEHGTGGESGSEGGEEGGTMLGLDATFDQVRNGAHLIMSYDKAARAFTGTVKNTTNATLQDVRVEVHLSNGTELGPTPPRNLAAGESMDVRLDAAGQSFDGWVPHAEVGPQSGGGEHGPSGEGGGS